MTAPRFNDAQRRHTHGPLRPLDDQDKSRLKSAAVLLVLAAFVVPGLLWLISQQLAPANGNTASGQEKTGGIPPERRPHPVEVHPIDKEQMP